MRTTSDEAQRAIVKSALVVFRKRGYAPATLEEIGAQVALTRGAVLHHFKSKGGLLTAVVDPCLQALEELLNMAPVTDPPSPRQRRQILTRFAEVLLAHRETLGLLANDVSARVQLGLDDQWLLPPGQLVRLLAGSRSTQLDRVRVAAAVGAMVSPVSWAWVDLDSPRARAELIEAAVVVLLGSRTTAADSVPRLGHGSQPVGPAPVTRVAAS
jgi:AcrR family transcriptional regulator